jgi:hypothetical protein
VLPPTAPWSGLGGSVGVTHRTGTQIIRANQAELMFTTVVILYEVTYKKIEPSITLLQLLSFSFSFLYVDFTTEFLELK